MLCDASLKQMVDHRFSLKGLTWFLLWLLSLSWINVVCAGALCLFVVSMAIVLAPKAFGWFAAMINIPRCLRFGGPILLTLSTLLETVMSGLYAPILMVSQVGVVFSIVRGKDRGWLPQSRDDGALSWNQLCTTMPVTHSLEQLLLSSLCYSAKNSFTGCYRFRLG